MKVPALRLNSKAGVPNPKADLEIYCGKRPPNLIYINVFPNWRSLHAGSADHIWRRGRADLFRQRRSIWLAAAQ